MIPAAMAARVGSKVLRLAGPEPGCNPSKPGWTPPVLRSPARASSKDSCMLRAEEGREEPEARAAEGVTPAGSAAAAAEAALLLTLSWEEWLERWCA